MFLANYSCFLEFIENNIVNCSYVGGCPRSEIVQVTMKHDPVDAM